MKAAHTDKRRHHYVPSVYMRGFLAGGERLYAYRKDNPSAPIHVPPESVAFENYYYSFVGEDGVQDNHQFENIFGTLENRWPDVLEDLRRQDIGTAGANWFLFAFATAMRARVPASREFRAALMAVEMRAGVQALHAVGHLPEQLKRYENELDTVPIGINPQQTLARMSEDMKAFGDLTLRLGFEILHNRTGRPFITSDNPVAYFDPVPSEAVMTPYNAENDIEFLFPISSDMILRGSHKLKPYSRVVRHRVVTNRDVVRRINRITARFAYRLVLSPDRTVDRMVTAFADISPVLWTRLGGSLRDLKIYYGHEFGQRPKLSKFVQDGEFLVI